MSTTAFYYSDAPYAQVMQGLYNALSVHEAIVTLTGEARSGKSTLCDKLTLYMRHKGFRVVYFRYPIESPDMLRAMLSRELDLPGSSNFVNILENIPLINDDKPLVVIFDDAHLMSDITLLDILHMTDVQSAATPKLNIVLCGEPLLGQKLARRQELHALQMRICHAIELPAMTAIELSGFVDAYMQKAALSGLRLEPAAQTCLNRYTQGLPGAARAFCAAIAAEHRDSTALMPVTKAELMAVSLGMQESGGDQLLPDVPYWNTNQWVVLGPVVVVVVIASISMLYQQLIGSDDTASETQATLVVSSPASDSEINSPFLSANVDRGAASAIDIEVPEIVPVEFLAEVAEEPEVAVIPVSDSDLVLVTATERGVPDAEIVEPDFEEVVAELANLSELAVDAPATAVAVVAEPVVVENNNTENTVAANDATENLVTENLVIANNVTANEITQRDIQHWIDAWQSQDLEAYFASYHVAFVPRYHDSTQRWQQDRSRVIGNARSIQLTLTEFEVVSIAPERMEVQFWLDYSSATYSDSTQKKLVLVKVDESWLILEEINLQVRS